MGKITQRDFSGGWRPSDDHINGAPNGLLRMNNVDLDVNGALNLIGGTTVVGSAFSNNLHSLYSRTMNGTRRIYSGDTSGNIFRDNTNIGSSGSSSIAAFGTAFNYTLCCSGNTRKKDTGSGTPANLGVGAPTVKPTLARSAYYPQLGIADLKSNTADNVGSSSVISSTYLQMTADGNGDVAVQTYNGLLDPHNATVLVNGDAGNSYGLDTDTITITGYTTNPFGKKLAISILLVAGNSSGDTVSDFYLYSIDDLSTLTFEPTTGVFTVVIKRSDFQRIGSGAQTWATTYGVRLTYKGDAGDVINILGSPSSSVGFITINGGSSAQNGVYQYMQVNVNNTGSYQALSPMGPIGDLVDVFNKQVFVTPQSPAAIDTQVNEVWIYRRGGKLDTWYRVIVNTDNVGWSGKYDPLSDDDALKLNIKYNQNLTTIASSGISDAILSIIGPIQGRWFYFTANFMYPSDINNPDLVDTTKGVRLTGSNNEIFLWAKQVDRATVLIGTSVDVYVLSGTFATLPDFTIDIYYYPLGCKYPPITYDADVYNGDVVYMASDGWRIININKENPLMVSPTSDLLYKGKTRYTYTAPNLKIPPGSVRFPVCIAQNKVWCFVYGTNRCEVFDFTRKYWRVFDYNLNDVTCVTSSQDGQVLAFYPIDKKIRELDVKTTKLIDGVTKQTVDLLWTVKDGELPRNRKDSQTFKSRIYTGGSDQILLSIINESGSGGGVGYLTSSTLGLDKYLDLSQIPHTAVVKTYQVAMIGTVADFLLEDWEILFTERPEQVSFYRSLNTNFGSASKKRVRNRPLVIDTLGNTVVHTPYVDNVAYPTTNISNSNKDTENLFITSDAFGVDYGYTLYSSSGLFEVYGDLSPVIVQTLPVAKRFDQIGPEEFLKYGRIIQFEVRILSYGTSIPYIIYASDASEYTGTISTTSGVEDSYYITVPKGTGGRVLRLVFGPTSFDFHRFHARILLQQTGMDTDHQWITIANE